MHRSGERRSDVSPATCSTSRSSRAAALGVTGRRARRPSVRSSSGSSVTSSSAKEPDELLTLFRDLIERVFTGKLDLYNGEKVVVVSDAIDGVRGDEATVKTQVGASQGAIPVDFWMVHRGDSWRACDIVIGGVSLVRNYRAQFDKVIKRTSYQQLVKQVREK